MNKILSKKEFEIMMTMWQLDKPASFSDILEANPNLNRNTLLAAIRRLISEGILRVDGFDYHKNSLTRLFVPVVSMYDYFAQFMSQTQKEGMIGYLKESLEPGQVSAKAQR